MFCTNCGQKNEERSAFCVNCGTALSGSHTPPSRKEGNLFGKKFCTRCGKDNRYYAEACKRCGGKEFTTKQTFDIWKKNWNSRSSFEKILSFGCATIVVVLLIGYLMEPHHSPSPATDLISYQTLRQWNAGDNGIGMDILVNESSTKDEVLKLATSLREQYDGESFLLVNIYDSRKAWEDNYNEKPATSFDILHTLVSVTRNKSNGYDKVEWLSEGRNR